MAKISLRNFRHSNCATSTFAMFINSILSLLKGRCHAERTSWSIPGRDGRECGGIHSFTAICKQTVSDICGIRVLARACADERSRDFGAMPQDSVWQKSCALIAAAKRVGCFVEITQVPGTRYTIRTGESDVRMVQKNPIIGFKTSLLQCLSNALSDEREISKLVSTLYCQSSNATIG